MKNITLIPGSDLYIKFQRLARLKQWRNEMRIMLGLWLILLIVIRLTW